MKNILRTLLFLILLIPRISDGQELKGCVVKILENLVVLDLGSEAGLQKNSKFDLIKDTNLDLPAAKVAVSQLYPEISVCKVLIKKRNIPLNEGDIVVLFASLSDEEIQIPVFENEKPEESIVVKPFTWKSKEIQELFQENLKQPFSIMLSYIYGYKPLAESVTSNIDNFTLKEIYGDKGSSTASISGGAGWSIAARKVLYNNFAFGLDYTRYAMNSEIVTTNELPGGEIEPLPGTISSWEYAVSTKIDNFSASLMYGNFKKISNYFATQNRQGSFIYHCGIGVDYMSISGTIDQIITEKTIFYKDYESFNTVENFKNSGYWGGHVSAGISYFIPVFRVFIEASYIKWGSSQFKGTFPLRTGFEIFF